MTPGDPPKWAPKNKLRDQVSIWQRWAKWLKEVALVDEDLLVVSACVRACL